MLLNLVIPSKEYEKTLFTIYEAAVAMGGVLF
jgi:hypothetical protein